MSINRWSKENQKLETLVPSTEPKEYYSTEETLTNKVWIDGKPIYRKTWVGAMSSIDGTTQNIDELVKFEGYVYSINNQIPYGYGDSVKYTFNKSTKLISLSYPSGYVNDWVTLEYTKNE